LDFDCIFHFDIFLGIFLQSARLGVKIPVLDEGLCDSGRGSEYWPTCMSLEHTYPFSSSASPAFLFLSAIRRAFLASEASARDILRENWE